MAESSNPWHLGYRPGLDGLRAVAVALVLWNHGGFQVVGAAGAVGVNIFFVLSGFLITRLLLEEKEQTGTVSLKRFYARRSLRLFPAMYAVLAATTVVALVEGLALSPIAYAAVYLLNVVKTAGMDVHLVSHMWTLSMEEQFYLLWPGVLLLTLRSGKRGRALLLVLIGLFGSLVVRTSAALTGAGLVYLHNSPSLAIGVLLAGCALALRIDSLQHSLLTRKTVFFAAWCVVIAASIGGKTTNLYALGIPAVTLASVAIISHLVQNENSNGIALALTYRPLIYLGKISYGLYLWHFIVFWLVRQNVGFHPYARWALQVAASVLVAAISYTAIELPFLRMKDRFKRPDSKQMHRPVTEDGGHL